MKKYLAVLLAALMLLSLTACGKQKKTAEVKRPAVESELRQFAGPEEGDTVAVFTTDKGTVKAVLYPDEAPMAVENFVGLARRGYYNGLTVHRVVYGSIIQSGDATGTGLGGASIWRDNPYPLEPSEELHHFAGALCAARTPEDERSALSQFYIVQALPGLDRELKDQMEEAGLPEAVIDAYREAGGLPALDNRYTVFGQVFEGMEVVDAIAAVETGEDEKPLEDLLIQTVEIITWGEEAG